MRAARSGTTIAIALALLMPGSAVGQEASPEPTLSPSPVPLEAESVAEPLPVADYWVEWIDHKEASHRRATVAITNAKRAGAKAARFYRKLVGVHSDELKWLDNHAPEVCYSAEYERWREATRDLQSVHKKTVRQGIRRTGKQQKAAIKRLNRAMSNIADCVESAEAVAEPTQSDNPFVGKWKGLDDFVAPDGFRDLNLTSLTIRDNGAFLLRDNRSLACRDSGYGYVPVTWRGKGEFVTEGSRWFRGVGQSHCYPRSGGRKALGEGFTTQFRYDAAADVLINVEWPVCYWRAKGGSPKDCKAFWRGTPAPVEDVEASVEETASTDEAATASPEADEG